MKSFVRSSSHRGRAHSIALALGRIVKGGWSDERVYLSWAKSLGAAHCVAQWARWKTLGSALAFPISRKSRWQRREVYNVLTFLDAVLVGLAVVLNLGGYALNALIIVVLSGAALLGVCALWRLWVSSICTIDRSIGSAVP